MTTKDTIQRYFDSLNKKSGWEAFLADDMTFTSFVSPIKQVTGKGAYLEATKRFFSMVTAVEVREVIVDGDRVCALTRYDLLAPGGRALTATLPRCSRYGMGRSPLLRSTLTVRRSQSRRLGDLAAP